MRNLTFRDMRAAPQNGTAVEVQHGPDQAVALARWSGQGQGWVRDDDPFHRSLHRVTGCRPLQEGLS
jgi:hypothetical protein